MSGPRIGSLCSGYGGLDMAAARVFGGRVVWVADTDPAAGAVLARRYPGVPNLGDIRGVDFARVGPVDVLTAGVGAPHRRERVFLLAWPADSPGPGRPGQGVPGRAAGGGVAAADPGRGGRAAHQRHLRAGEPDAGRGATAHAASDGRHQRRAEPAGQQGRSDVAEYGGAAGVEWGRYQAAIDGWAAVLGRPAPDPVDDRARLAPRFVEWLMGLPAGWVTDIPGISRAARLRLLGNGVIPQHATAAIHQLAHTADGTAGPGVRAA